MRNNRVINLFAHTLKNKHKGQKSNILKIKVSDHIKLKLIISRLYLKRNSVD